MTQEDKELLLKDLCARLPYGIECKLPDGTSGMITSISIVPHGIFVIVYFNRDNVEDVSLEDIKPYLRPMSSMTEEEKEELKYVIELGLQALESEEGHNIVSAAPAAFEVDFYNKHHIDYRGLIPMGLALEAPRDMYKTE